jgi:hypothetical protein
MAATLDASPAATPAPTAAPVKAPRRRFWQFSLFSLLLLVVIGCLVGAWLGERRQHRETEERLKAKEAENRQYRIDLGLLDDQPGVLAVSDPMLVHVRKLPWFDPSRPWRWRLYLPPGKQWRLVSSQGEELDEGSGDFQGSKSRTNVNERGEITLEGSIDQKEDGRAQVRMRWGTRGMSFWIRAPGMRVLTSAQGERTVKFAGQPKQESFPASGRIELLRWHVEQKEGDDQLDVTTPVGQPIPPRSYGLSIYLEEVLPNEPISGESPKQPARP